MSTYSYDVLVLDFNPFFRIRAAHPYGGHPDLQEKVNEPICRIGAFCDNLILQQSFVRKRHISCFAFQQLEDE